MSVIVIDWIIRSLAALLFLAFVGLGAKCAWDEWKDGNRFGTFLYGLYSGWFLFLTISMLITTSEYRQRREGKLVPCPTCHQEYTPNGK